MEKDDRKKAAREQKKKSRQEEEEAKEKFEYEQYKIKEKDEQYQNKQQRRKQEQGQHEEKKKNQAEKHKELNKEQQGKIKHSKPAPALAPFAFFKDEHSSWDPDKIKEEWGKLNEEGKAKYKELARTDRERHRHEMEEYNKAQEFIKVQKTAGGERQNRGKH